MGNQWKNKRKSTKIQTRWIHSTIASCYSPVRNTMMVCQQAVGSVTRLATEIFPPFSAGHSFSKSFKSLSWPELALISWYLRYPFFPSFFSNMQFQKWNQWYPVLNICWSVNFDFKFLDFGLHYGCCCQKLYPVYPGRSATCNMLNWPVPSIQYGMTHCSAFIEQQTQYFCSTKT